MAGSSDVDGSFYLYRDHCCCRDQAAPKVTPEDLEFFRAVLVLAVFFDVEVIEGAGPVRPLS
jgi:hypothetical protein